MRFFPICLISENVRKFGVLLEKDSNDELCGSLRNGERVTYLDSLTRLVEFLCSIKG